MSKRLYSFEKITIFSWRSKGERDLHSSSKIELNNPLLGKQFLINNSFDYSPPALSGKSSDGSFLNTGPKEQILKKGDKVDFTFEGLRIGSSKPKFVEIRFLMLPYESSKLTTSKTIFYDIENDIYNFQLNIEKIILQLLISP